MSRFAFVAVLLGVALVGSYVANIFALCIDFHQAITWTDRMFQQYMYHHMSSSTSFELNPTQPSPYVAHGWSEFMTSGTQKD
jgi:hypothetical protein